ncbi:unnamed protein product, partial [Rotaria magnacalcarata]
MNERCEDTTLTISPIDIEASTNVDQYNEIKVLDDLLQHANFITKQLEKKLGVDLNGDGIIGSGMKLWSWWELGRVFQEKCLHNSRIILLNKDGRIGRGPAPFPNYSQSYNSYGGPPNFQSGNSGMINELEKATNIDLNHDGRIGGGPAPFPNYPQSYNSYGGPPNFQSGNS